MYLAICAQSVTKTKKDKESIKMLIFHFEKIDSVVFMVPGSMLGMNPLTLCALWGPLLRSIRFQLI